MSSATFDPFELLGLFVPYLPLFLVWLVGCVLAVARWQRHPAVSLLTLLAIGLFVMSSVLGTLFSYWLTQQQMAGSGPYWTRSLVAVGIMRSLLATLAWAFLLVAIFRWRAPAPGSEPWDANA